MCRFLPLTAAVAASAVAASAGSTIPMSAYTIVSSKDGKTYSGVMVGTSPFGPISSATIPMDVIPLRVEIGSRLFDPLAANVCDGNVSAVNRFRNSPIVNPTDLVFNGVSVGPAQFIDGFRRAEFWGAIQGSPGYHNTLSPVVIGRPIEVSAPPGFGTVAGSDCSTLGIVSGPWLQAAIKTLIPTLLAKGAVATNHFVLFLTRDVVQSTSEFASAFYCCVTGYHSSAGNPVLTYAVADWDTTGLFRGTADGAIVSHELAEWMDDPLGTNQTPPWGGMGQTTGCETGLEVGDPMTGLQMPPISVAGYRYHMQELGFFSWYYSRPGDASLGAGGKFSSNGTLNGPSKPCPAGGTF